MPARPAKLRRPERNICRQGWDNQNSLIGWWERKWPQLENSPHRLLKPNAATSDGLATLMPVCSPMEKWTRVYPNTRPTRTLPRAVDSPAPRPGLVMVPPCPSLLQISDLTEHGWVSCHTSLCPETSFQTCLPGTVLGFPVHPVIRGLTRPQAGSGSFPEGTQCGLPVSAPAPRESLLTLTPFNPAEEQPTVWTSGPQSPQTQGPIGKKYL